MRCAGIDIGSRTIKLVLVEDGKAVESRQADSGHDSMRNAGSLLDGMKYDRIMATGYGRHLLEIGLNAPTVTEIKAHAEGARALFPNVRAILDIGGQDSKAIALDERGKIAKFEMNDRCAAGTGKFLEIMARTLGYDLNDFGREALKALRDIQVNSMCTVFAESEVTSLLARGEDRREIALGLHRSVILRAVGMLKRIPLNGPIVFSGGVAKNPCMRRLLSQAMKQDILVPEDPQMTGALGAALLAMG
jgi:predicted CoA-substrate-specific enzyme activase